MFSAYRQEVNLKFYNFQNILLKFFFGPHVCTGNFSFNICGFVLCRVVRNVILFPTHIIFSQHLTNNFSLHTTRYSHATMS
jgi:hypothetical protein